MPRASILRSCLLLGLLSIAGLGSARAEVDLAPYLQNARTATESVVVLVPPMSVYRNDLTEVSLRQEGCRYASSDVPTVRSLVALLESAHITAQPVYQRPDIREGVYLAMADGSRIAFFLQDNNGGKLPVQGIVETSSSGIVQTTAITAASTLATDLRSWATEHGGSGEGSACNRRPLPTTAPEALPAPAPR